MKPVLDIVRLACAIAVFAAIPIGLAFPVLAHAATPAPLPTPNTADYSFTLSAAPQTDIRLSGIDAQGRTYLNGHFDAVNGVNMPGLARIAPDGTLDAAWIAALPPADVVVPGMAVQDGAGRLVVLHSDGKLYRVDATNGSVVPLTLAQCDDHPRTLAVDPSNSDIYVACYALTLGVQVGITPPQGAFAHVYRINGATAVQDPAFDLVMQRIADCSPSFYAPVKVFTLVHDGAGHLYVGGHFTSVTDGAISAHAQAGLFRAATPSGTVDTAWQPAAPPPGVQPCLGFWATQLFVTSVALSPGNVAYVAGFRGTSAYLGRVSTLGAGAADASWAPPALSQTSPGAVISLALDPLRNRLYAGALFTDSSSNPQPYLRAFSTLPGAVLDAAWDPQPDSGSTRLLVDRDRGRLVVGGDFSLVGGVSRPHVAGLPLTGDTIMANYYQSILGRAPDPSGIAFWPGEIVRLTAKGVSANEVYMAMANFFFSSPEFAATPLTDAQFIEKLYLTFLARPSDPSGSAFWASQIASGLTREMVMYAFMFSPEFNTYMSANLPTTMIMPPDTGVVLDFYRGALARLPDDSGLDFWRSQFIAAHCGTGDVYATAIGISESFFNGAEYNAAPSTSAQYVSDLYNAFLRRSADAPGFNFWVNQLETNAMTRAAMRSAFIASPEFGTRVQAIANSACVAPLP